MSPIKSILVLGAGELGIQVIKAISDHQPVREKHVSLAVALRPVSSSSSTDTGTIESLGCSIIRHDIATLDVAGLSHVLAPFDAVVSCLGFAAGSGVQLKISQAAIAARVKRFIPWQFGVDYDAIGRGSGQTLFDEQLDVRTLLRAQTEVDWVILSTGVFTSFVFEQSFGIVEAVKDAAEETITVRALGSWENGLTVTSVEDIGKLTTTVLFDKAVKQEVVYTSGDTFSYHQLAEVVGRVMQKPVRKELWSREYLASDLTKDPEDTIRKYRIAFAAGRGVSWEKGKTYNMQKGIETSDLEHWMRQNLL